MPQWVQQFRKDNKMAYVKEYWNNKEERAKMAREHTKNMEQNYARMIQTSIFGTKIYDTDFQIPHNKLLNNDNMDIIVDDLDSVSAIFKHNEGKTAVLNFSSYKNSGGMFLNGSKAQEECLCHESFLYNVLKEFVIEFYDWNNRNKNRALYKNRGLYSPSVMFLHNEEKKMCDVITCAAPNKSAAQKYQNVSDSENNAVLVERIRFILDMSVKNEVNTLILGAYGCGVFGQDAKEVALVFKEFLGNSHHSFDKVVFAVSNGRDGNLQKFREVFEN